MSEKSLDYKNQYVSTINTFVTGCIMDYQRGRYYESLNKLLPVLAYLVVPDDETEAKVKSWISQIAKVDELKDNSGQTRDSNEWRTKKMRNKVSKGLFPLMIREVTNLLRELGYYSFDESGKFIDLTGGKRLE